MQTPPRGSWASRWRPEIVLVALVLVVAGPIVQVLMAHQISRLVFTAAVADGSTVQIDAYEDLLAVDFAERDGHLYSDKAPGQPFLVAPAYVLARAVGAEPPDRVLAHHAAGDDAGGYFNNYTLWWVSLWSSTIPAAVLAVMMRRLSLHVTRDGRAATAGAVGVALCTLLLPFSTVLFGHVLAATLGFAAYLAARDPDAPPLRLAAAGLLGGLAVLTEYTTGIVVIVVGLLVLHRHRFGVLAYAAGGLPAVALLGLYNAVAWGSPTSFSYDYSGTFGEFHDQGLFGISVPDPALTVAVLAGERGLLTLTPVVLAGLIGLVLLARRRETREVGVVGLVVFAAFVAVQGGWFSVTAGASPGPRYVVPALPFLAVGVARAWRWSRAVVIGAAVIGAVPMLLSIATNPLAQPTEDFTAGHWVWRALEGRWGDTLLTPFVDAPWAHLVQLLVALAVFALLCRVTGRSVPTPSPTAPAVLDEPAAIDEPAVPSALDHPVPEAGSGPVSRSGPAPPAPDG